VVWVDDSVFDAVPSPNAVVSDGTVNIEEIESPFGKLEGNPSTIFRASQMEPQSCQSGGLANLSNAQTIASAIVTLKPGALSELYWHPNVSTSLHLRYHPADT
jgi:oxalate decarboxylase/phosphoglucose isomerase-like protein (cupin superfamily)